MKRIFVNLKDYLSLEDNIKYAENSRNLDVTIFPSNPYLHLYSSNKIGVQDVSPYNSGAHTGNVSASHLKDFGIKWAILNHKEIEIKNKKLLRSKINNCIKNKICIIICIKNFNFSTKILLNNILKSDDDYSHIKVAFEPTIQYDEKTLLKKLTNIKNFFYRKGINISLLYGGKVLSTNIKKYNFPILDGFLIGQGALDIDEVKKMINEISSSD